MMLIDPHVHLRDWDQARKETLAHAFGVAWRAGISGLIEMPNTSPALTTMHAARDRIADADRAAREVSQASGTAGAPFHALYMGLTADPDQVEAAVQAYRELFPRVAGFKLYAGHSTGRMGVIATTSQLTVWRALCAADYRGVVAVHAEREDLLLPERFDISRPASHSEARPPLAEIASVQTQIAFAEATGFRGTLHICHVSAPETLELIAAERSGLPFRLTSGVTPHHVYLDTSDAATPGFLVNPPLRDPARREALSDTLFGRERTPGAEAAQQARGAPHTDDTPTWIESDHAPHTWDEKLGGACGLPGLLAFRELADQLHETVPAKRAHTMTGAGVLEVFEIDPALIPPNPHAEHRLSADQRRELAAAYPWDPYERFHTRE